MKRRTLLLGVLGASDRVRAGVIGSGGRGQYLTAEFKEQGAEVLAVCDVYEPHLAAGLKLATTGARGYDDYRRLLEDGSIDAVVIATPDHWHARMLVDAVEAGKDVYLEKPMARTIEEGFQMVAAVRRNRRVVQVGTQRRSGEMFIEAADILRSGAAGEVRLVNSWWYNHKRALRRDPLKGKLDWEKWQGPAPKRTFEPARFYDWLYFWDYAGALLVGQGAHIIDGIQMLMNSTWPLAVTCSALSPQVEGAEVPETTCMTVEFPEKYLAVFTCGYKAMTYAMVNDQLKQFNGSRARFDVGREFYTLWPQTTQPEMKPSQSKTLPGSFAAASRAHVRNFIECVRSRKEPNATIEMGQHTNVALCMAVESLRTGRRLVWDAARKRVA